MSSVLNDLWVAYLKSEGYGGESYNTLTANALREATGADNHSTNTLWYIYLTGLGYSGALNDMWYAWLGDNGYTGALPDRWKAALEDGFAFFGFDPLTLFDQGQQGAWYDPSDLTTLFQDSTGTTPVTADGDPVGLLLDARLGLVRGPDELASISAWETLGGNTLTTLPGGRSQIVNGGSTAFRSSQPLAVTEGLWYSVSIDVENVNIPENLTVRTMSGAWSTTVGQTFSAVPVGKRRTVTAIFKAGADETRIGTNAPAQDGGTVILGEISVRELPGNHASQPTSLAKPVYRTDGTLHWLDFDGVDDQLVATIPSITNATVAIAKSTGTEITYPVDLSSGEFVMDETNYGVIVREGEFTEQEALNVTAYLNAKAGIES